MLPNPHVHDQASHYCYWCFYEQCKNVSDKFYEPVLLANLASMKQIGPKNYENRRNWQWFSNIFNMGSQDFIVLSSSVTFGNIWLMSCPQAPVHYSLRLLVNLLGMSASDILSSQSCGRLALSQSWWATRVAKGIPATLNTAITDKWNDYRKHFFVECTSKEEWALFSEFPRCFCRWGRQFSSLPSCFMKWYLNKKQKHALHLGCC